MLQNIRRGNQVIRNPLIRSGIQPFGQDLELIRRGYSDLQSNITETWHYVEDNIDVVKDGVNIIDSIVINNRSSGIPVLDELVRYISTEPIYSQARTTINNFDTITSDYKEIATEMDKFIVEGIDLLNKPNDVISPPNDVIQPPNVVIQQPEPSIPIPIGASPLPITPAPVVGPTYNIFGVQIPTEVGTPSLSQQIFLPLTTFDFRRPANSQLRINNKDVFRSVSATFQQIARLF